MEYKKLGRTGLDVSPICLGCMTYGDPSGGGHAWAIGEEASRPLVRQAVETGINFFDTANTYSGGTSEEITGRLLKEFCRRDETVVATKVFFQTEAREAGATGGRPNRSGLSRKAILEGIDASLRRLGMDYVDLYQIHRWDPHVPIEETMEALHDVVKAGKARYLGASSMHAWQFAKAQHVAERHGWTRFSTMQNHVNLLYREEEREMLPLCLDQGVAAIPWSPLARGKLARPPGEETERSKSDKLMGPLYQAMEEADRAVIAALGQVADARGVPRAQVALAWVSAKRAIAAPIVGASKPRHLTDAIASLEIMLTGDETRILEAPYVPHPVSGHA